MLSVFISGLSKHSGKTLVAAGLAGTMQSLNYSTDVYKPVQTGAYSLNGFLKSSDLTFIKKIDSNIRTFSTYAFVSSKTPLVASYEASNTRIELNTIYNDYHSNIKMTECHIVEGSNSIAAPVGDKITEADIIKTLGLPLLLVLNPEKNSVSDVLSGISFIHSQKLNFLGIIVNDYNENSKDLEEKYFPQIIKEYTGANILGILPHYESLETLTPDTLISDVLNNVKLEEIMGLKIAKLNF